jgi:hypothetical protein
MEFIENIRDIHIGKIIEKKFAEKSMTKTDFANKINRSRTDINDIFKRESIDAKLLIEISKVLEYDFIQNVYYKEPPLPEIPDIPAIYIAVKINEDMIKNLELPKEIICLTNSQRPQRKD